ncbi:hypothetical protein ACH5RR_026104 [Cinchona calisaya]|uniref:DUF4283 domain-containing protein n=1 Tax=Cinchona calisaya TaxID=153742 RepID=A0ABD2Z1K3_9GENT
MSFAYVLTSSSMLPVKKHTLYRGKLTLLYIDEEIAILSKPLKHALIGFIHHCHILITLKKRKTTNIVDFRVDQESLVAPVWVFLKHIPFYLCEKQLVFSIASMIGTPLKMDASTTTLSCSSVERFCVEVDVSKPLLQRVSIGNEGSSFGRWQYIHYEDLP